MTSEVSRAELTVDEVVATLKRSHLPTVLTEGRDDYLIFRELEEDLVDIGVSLMPVGGRDCLLSVFRRRSETGRADNLVFIADRDIWVMHEIPDIYMDESLIFTDGYSIENDLYRDGNLERLLSAKERETFVEELREFVRWYAFAVERCLNGFTQEFGCKPEHVLDGQKLRASFLVQAGYNEPSEEIYDRILGDYKRLLRGKSLLRLLMRQLSRRQGQAKYTYGALLEISASNGGAHMSSIKAAAEALLKPAVGKGQSNS